MNLNTCHVCGERSIPLEEHRKEDVSEDSEEEMEEVSFRHTCASCHHVIAEHYYRFVSDSVSQRYLMECMLCGRGAFHKRYDIVQSERCDDNQSSREHLEDPPRLCEPIATTRLPTEQLFESLAATLPLLDMTHQTAKTDEHNAVSDDEWDD